MPLENLHSRKHYGTHPIDQPVKSASEAMCTGSDQLSVPPPSETATETARIWRAFRKAD
jgi:hypothetical protein